MRSRRERPSVKIQALGLWCLATLSRLVHRDRGQQREERRVGGHPETRLPRTLDAGGEQPAGGAHANPEDRRVVAAQVTAKLTSAVAPTVTVTLFEGPPPTLQLPATPVRETE